MADRPYVRVFHADLIRDYPHVWDDDAALAAWMRLLVLADGAWPAPAELPRSIRDRSLSALTDAGLVALDGPHRFRIKGMDADRIARSNAARNASAKRWHSGSDTDGIKRANAPRNAEPMPNRAEQSNTEQRSSAPASNDPYADDEAEVRQWLANHGCFVRPGNGYDQKLVTAVARHGSDALVSMMVSLKGAGTKDGDIKGFLFGAIDALDARNRPKLAVVEAGEREAERASSMARRLQATQIRLHDNGAHFEEPSPSCPRCAESKEGAKA